MSETIANREIEESVLKGRLSGRPSAVSIDDEPPQHVPGELACLKMLPGSDLVGVVKYVRDRCYNGYTLFSPRMGNTAYMVDMEGRIVHTWPVVHCQLAELQPDGSVVADDYNHGLNQTNALREKVWNFTGPYHHDFQFMPNGRIVLVAFKMEPPLAGLFEPGTEPEKLRTDVIWEIDRAGKIHWEFDFGKHLLEIRDLGCLPLPLPRKIAQSDWAHANTVEILPDTPLGRKDPRFRAGNLMFCFRQLDIIGVIDREQNAIVWAWGRSELDGPHQPTMLPNGNILVFDNGTLRGYSRVLEYSPLERRVVWRYEDPKTFYSPYRAGADRLPNGNTLICSADQSRIFEISPAGEILWDYYPPYSNQNEVGFLSRRMYRATRYTDAQARAVLNARTDADWSFVPYIWLTDERVVPHVTVTRAGGSEETLVNGSVYVDSEKPYLMPEIPKDKRYLFQHASGNRLVLSPPKDGTGKTTAVYPIVPAADRRSALRVSPKAVALNGGGAVRVTLKVGDDLVYDETLEAGQGGRMRHFDLGRLQRRLFVTFGVESMSGAAPSAVDWGEILALCER